MMEIYKIIHRFGSEKELRMRVSVFKGWVIKEDQENAVSLKRAF